MKRGPLNTMQKLVLGFFVASLALLVPGEGIFISLEK